MPGNFHPTCLQCLERPQELLAVTYFPGSEKSTWIQSQESSHHKDGTEWLFSGQWMLKQLISLSFTSPWPLPSWSGDSAAFVVLLERFCLGSVVAAAKWTWSHEHSIDEEGDWSCRGAQLQNQSCAIVSKAHFMPFVAEHLALATKQNNQCLQVFLSI